uniref:SERRATE/Ars2 C-terminal domain-containing protein n=1 Tax=Eptatretus burgeri TaxID=7764 RepID=A0A8C4R0G7_EPTBU
MEYETIAEDEGKRLGKRDPEEEVEKFVSANTQEAGKDTWLCPLSGKKFKTAEFVRKHIFNKHTVKIEEVKKEVAFFNNFLMDARRPHEVEPRFPYPASIPGQITPHPKPYFLSPLNPLSPIFFPSFSFLRVCSCIHNVHRLPLILTCIPCCPSPFILFLGPAIGISPFSLCCFFSSVASRSVLCSSPSTSLDSILMLVWSFED